MIENDDRLVRGLSAREEMMEGLLWFHFMTETRGDFWPTHVPLAEWDACENEWDQIVAEANKAKAAGEVDAYDPIDGARLTEKGVEVATAMFPDARAKWEAAERERAMNMRRAGLEP